MSNKRIKTNERIKVVKRLREYRDPRTRSERHAIAFINYLSDYCPRSDMKVLPFETVKQVSLCNRNGNEKISHTAPNRLICVNQLY